MINDYSLMKALESDCNLINEVFNEQIISFQGHWWTKHLKIYVMS